MSKSRLDAGVPRHLAGRYQLLEKLADGAMTTVWRGHDQVLGRDVGVKLLHASLAADEGFADQSHFTQAFRRHVGIPPARYRRLARAQGNGFLSPPVTRET